MRLFALPLFLFLCEYVGDDRQAENIFKTDHALFGMVLKGSTNTTLQSFPSKRLLAFVRTHKTDSKHFFHS